MLALAIFLAVGQQEPLTFGAARALPPQEVERRIFQAERGTTREVVVHNLFGNMYRAQQRAEFSIDFADAPTPTTMPGLCSVQIRTAVFGRGYEPNAGKDAPTHLLEVTEQTRYALRLSKNDSSAVEDGPCLHAPVIDNPRYFEVWGDGGRAPHPGTVVVAVRAIQSMILEAAAKRPAAMVACTEDPFAALGGTWDPLCADANRSIAKLRWEEISSLNVRHCGGEQVCIKAFFRRPVALRSVGRMVELNFEVDGAKIDPVGGGGSAQPESVTLLGVTAID